MPKMRRELRPATQGGDAEGVEEAIASLVVLDSSSHVGAKKEESDQMPSTRSKRARKDDAVMAAEKAMDKAADGSRQAITALIEDWTCPITYELLFEPVEAEDGRLYERAAIEQYFEHKADQVMVRSPVTNQEMGKRLVPATHVRGAITKLVQSGQVDAETTATWKQARLNLVQVTALRAKAAKGDAHAMGRLGFSYRDGTRGLKRDPKEAFYWFKKAADLKDPPAACSCGVAYINGSGVERNHTRGISMVTIAALLGSEHACSVLGWANECGHHGFNKDPEEATKWYKEMQKAPCRDSVDAYRTRATEWLLKHPDS
jgi:TPR repeat protein